MLCRYRHNIDDATRVIPFAAFAYADNTTAFLPVFKQAIARRGLPARLYVEYVARHIFDIMFPAGLCGMDAGDPRRAWRGPRVRTHFSQSDFSQFSSDWSSRQTVRPGNASSFCNGGAVL